MCVCECVCVCMCVCMCVCVHVSAGGCMCVMHGQDLEYVCERGKHLDGIVRNLHR